MQRQALVNYLNKELVIDTFDDYCPNGLQVEGRDHVHKILTGVTASQRLIDKAVELNVDALIVHHGFFWKNESAVITSMKKRRIAQLLKHDINLLAYHLPLDAHEKWGNNAQLAKLMGWNIDKAFLNQPFLVSQAQLEKAICPSDLATQLSEKLQRSPLHIPAENKALIQRVAWCTGAAQGFMAQLNGYEIDAYISGEISESTTHMAREMNIHYFAAGHHATERYGVMALGEHLSEKFGLEQQFVDIDNPV